MREGVTRKEGGRERGRKRGGGDLKGEVERGKRKRGGDGKDKQG